MADALLTRGLAGTRERVGKPQLDERLTAHTDSPGLAVDGVEQIDGKVDIHALDFTAWARGLRQIKMRAKVLARVMHLIEARGAERLSLRGTALLRLRAHGGPR
jgi:hypothetical protein